MTYYSRNLPHWHPEGKAIFLTFRLHGSIPAVVLRKLAVLQDYPRRQFTEAERKLDAAQSGPKWLAQPEVAGIVESALLMGQEQLNFYVLEAYVVMPDHVHSLLRLLVPLSRITKGLKGVSAREANQVLGRIGQPFWQDESFDHWVRSPAEFERIRTYIEMNPVKAGLVVRPGDWPWSSAHR
jgi:REP element-mobilizing transposase RayT